MIRITIESGKIVIETDEMPEIIHKSKMNIEGYQPVNDKINNPPGHDPLLRAPKKPYKPKPKKCPDCGLDYQPTSNAQIICKSCKEKLNREINQAIVEAPKVDELEKTINEVMDRPGKSHPEQLDEIIEKQKQKVKKICPECGKEFEQIHPYQIYCSELCRNRSARKRREEKLKNEVREEMKKEPSLEGKIPLFIEKLKATFFVNRHMTEEQKEEYKRNKIKEHEEKMKIK